MSILVDLTELTLINSGVFLNIFSSEDVDEVACNLQFEKEICTHMIAANDYTVFWYIHVSLKYHRHML